MSARVVIPDPELDWEGEWSALTNYVEGDVVFRAGSSFRAKVASFGKDPISFSGEWEVVASKGDPGSPGNPGPPGPPGTGGTISHDVTVPSAVWTWVHGLDLSIPPEIRTYDSVGRRVYGEEEYLDANTVRITFTANGLPAPMGGKIILNF